MSEELRNLYQEMILDHNKSPRNFRVPLQYNRKADGFNPLCGDSITLYLEMDGDIIKDMGFQGTGCAISRASSSMMTENLKGKNSAEALQCFEKFHAMITADPQAALDLQGMGKLEVFSGVREFPARMKCAKLAWHTFKAALDGKDHVVSTETEKPKEVSVDMASMEEKVIAAIRKCYDPEIPVNIYDLGLIYGVHLDPSGAALIKMTLTSPHCPAAASLPMDVQNRVRAVEGVTTAKVDVVWDPPWNPNKMSEAAKLELGMM